MATIAENLQEIIDIKSNIKTAIENKGVDMSNTTFGDYANKIGEISGGVAKIDVGGLGLKFGYSTFTTIPDVFDFSNITDMSNMFYGCRNLTEIPLFDTSNVENWSSAFRNTYKPIIPEFNTRVARDFTYLFYYSYIENIPELKCGYVNSMDNAFYNCMYIINVGGFKDFGKAFTSSTGNRTLSIKDSASLTYESCMNIINKVYDLNNTTYDDTATIRLHSTPFSLLTSDDIAIATNKGWTITT